MNHFLVVLLLLSSSISYASIDKELWDRSNHPRLVSYDHNGKPIRFEIKFNNLPLQGVLPTIPWSGDYWPTYKGGISYRWNDYSSDDWNEYQRFGYDYVSKESLLAMSQDELAALSPAEKYDIYLGNYDFPLVKYERKRTQILRTVPGLPDYDSDFEIPTWEGLCHGWAPATLLYGNPKSMVAESVDGIKIPFGSSDIKALLTYNFHYNNAPKTYFLGQRCNLNFSQLQDRLYRGEITQRQYDMEIELSECRDVNAGSFHVVLANQISILKQGLIADVTRDFEVWNQPVYAYEYDILSQSGPSEHQQGYGVHKVYKVAASMKYIVEVGHSWSVDINHGGLATRYYDYYVEVDNRGQIIGGEWISEDRPDFLWKKLNPGFKKYFKGLEKIYNQSL